MEDSDDAAAEEAEQNQDQRQETEESEGSQSDQDCAHQLAGCTQSGGQQSGSAPSWSPDKPLPTDPSQLGPDWRKNPGYKNPNGEEYINDKTGEKIEWNKGRPGHWGPKADRGKDGWHYTPPGGERSKQYDPGKVIKQVGFWGTVGLIIRGVWAAIEACAGGPCEAL